MKYMLVFIAGSADAGSIFAPTPGAIHEVERFNSLEDAVNYAKAFGNDDERFVIVPYYEVK
jgi:hypothetical protein